MASTTGTFTHYAGPFASIPSPTTPGLTFISAYVPTIGAIDRSSDTAKKLDNLLAPDAVFITNGAPPVTKDKIAIFLGMREKNLERFGHSDGDVQIWDMEEQGGSRKVVFEAFSTSVFKEDEKREEINVHELIMLKLEKASEGSGIAGYWVTEVKAYMDPGAMLAKVKLFREKKSE